MTNHLSLQDRMGTLLPGGSKFPQVLSTLYLHSAELFLES